MVKALDEFICLWPIRCRSEEVFFLATRGLNSVYALHMGSVFSNRLWRNFYVYPSENHHDVYLEVSATTGHLSSEDRASGWLAQAAFLIQGGAAPLTLLKASPHRGGTSAAA